jgi:hypothetical protein
LRKKEEKGRKEKLLAAVRSDDKQHPKQTTPLLSYANFLFVY